MDRLFSLPFMLLFTAVLVLAVFVSPILLRLLRRSVNHLRPA